jgi:hypothetical protein
MPHNQICASHCCLATKFVVSVVLCSRPLTRVVLPYACLQENASSTAAALQLPGVCAQTLYQQQAPQHLQSVAKQALKKQLA